MCLWHLWLFSTDVSGHTTEVETGLTAGGQKADLSLSRPSTRYVQSQNQRMNTSNHSDLNESDRFLSNYNDSLICVLIYNGIRCLQMIMVITGNGMTLQIIRNLKVVRNGHLLLIYLAISDILVSSMVPLATFTTVSRFLNFDVKYWKPICIIKENLYVTAAGLSLICYSMLSVDR